MSAVQQEHQEPRGVLDLFSLKGRTIIVTGAAGGLGANFVQACIQAGASVAAIDIAPEPKSPVQAVDSTAPQYRYYQASVADEELIEQTVSRVVEDFGVVDGCITCAGIAGESPFHQYPTLEVRKIVDVNLLGSFFVVQSVIRQMLSHGIKGSIILISSVAAHQANRGHAVSAYGASKYAVRGLTQQIAAEYASNGIRVNSISPGPMMTDMARRLAAGNPEVFEALSSHIMLGRMGEPHELNGAAVFLLSDASSFVTGEDILVDGGQGHL